MILDIWQESDQYKSRDIHQNQYYINQQGQSIMDKQAQTQQQQAQPKLYPTLCQGDIRIEKTKRRAILLVGRTRTGKSTAMQWLRGRALIGSKCGGSVIYVNQSDGAKVSSSLISETLIPNIITLQDDFSLVDTAGLEDERGYVGVIGVSYMLKALFQKVEQVKFVIVMNASTLEQLNAKQITSSFMSFLKMFDFKNLSPNLQQKVMDSVYVLLSRVQKEKQVYTQNLIEFSKEFGKSQMRNVDKKQIQMILKHIQQKDKIIYFRAAEENAVAIPSQLPKQFVKSENWHFINLKEMEEEINSQNTTNTRKELIHLPFKEDFKTCEADFDLFLADIDRKIKSFQELARLCGKFFIKLMEGNNMFQPQTKYDQQFKGVEQFLNNHDEYDQEIATMPIRVKKVGFDIDIQEKKTKQNPPYGLTLIQKVIEFYNLTVKLDNTCISMDILRDKMMEALKIFCDIFAKTQDQQIMCIDLAFVIFRAFRELTLLASIDEEHVKAEHSIHGNMNTLSEIDIYNIESKYVFESKSESHTFGKKLTTDIKTLGGHISHVYNFEPIDGKDRVKLEKVKVDTIGLKADCLHFKQMYKESVIARLQANEELNKYRGTKQLHQEEDNPQFDGEEQNEGEESISKAADKEHQALNETLADIEMTQLEISSKLAETLRVIKRLNADQVIPDQNQLDQHPEESLNRIKQRQIKVECLRFALSISKSIIYVDQACQDYQGLLKILDSRQQKYTQIMEYAAYTMENGRIQQSRINLQRAIELAPNSTARKDTKKKMSELEWSVQTSVLLDDYKQKVANYPVIKNPGQVINDIKEYFGFDPQKQDMLLSQSMCNQS